jgi:hypothetical protein
MRDQEIKAADDLESLVPELKQVIADIREGKGQAYARVYYFRTKVSRVVATLGSGQPPRVQE